MELCKCIRIPLKSKFSILGSRRYFLFGIESIDHEDEDVKVCQKCFISSNLLWDSV